jgi:hypothetical protein
VTDNNKQQEIHNMNKNTKHTPGPWETFANAGGHVVQGESFETIAVLPKWDKEHTDEQTANAALIAAAPVMLAALNRCIRELSVHHAHDCSCITCNTARAAIAKATAENRRT